MYELAYIPLEKLRQITPAIGYDQDNIEGLCQAIRLYGARPAILNRATGRLMSNPAELEALAAIRDAGQPLPAATGAGWSVPTILGEWPQQDEIKAALCINGGLQARLLGIPTLDTIFPALMSYNSSNFEDVHALGIELLEFQHILDTLAGQPPDEPADEPPSATGWGIPTLDLNLQGQLPIQDLRKWGSMARTTDATGATYHFYTDDSKFRALTGNPQLLIDSGCSAIIEPNFSSDPGTPKALAIAAIYHKRQLARHAQLAGMRVHVDLNIEQCFFDLALIGVPVGWSAYANRGYSRDVQHLIAAYELAAAHSDGRPVNYLVYGGGREVEQLCSGRGWTWIADEATQRHGAR